MCNVSITHKDTRVAFTPEETACSSVPLLQVPAGSGRSSTRGPPGLLPEAAPAHGGPRQGGRRGADCCQQVQLVDSVPSSIRSQDLLLLSNTTYMYTQLVVNDTTVGLWSFRPGG